MNVCSTSLSYEDALEGQFSEIMHKLHAHMLFDSICFAIYGNLG